MTEQHDMGLNSFMLLGFVHFGSYYDRIESWNHFSSVKEMEYGLCDIISYYIPRGLKEERCIYIRP